MPCPPAAEILTDNRLPGIEFRKFMINTINFLNFLQPLMDPLTNPYAPGVGTPPPEPAWRDSILAAADVAIQRNRLCRPARSFMFIGLRGVGKTVLLNEVGRIAEKHDAISDFFGVGTNGPLLKVSPEPDPQYARTPGGVQSPSVFATRIWNPFSGLDIKKAGGYVLRT